MPYLYHTDEDRKQMLDALGLSSEEELFEKIPAEFRSEKPPPVGEGRTEHEVVAEFERIAAKNQPAGKMISFLGGGIYDHVIPSAVTHLSARSEFVTAYTPYQPEVSQGTLQAIFEFQSMITRLTGLPVSNASMYDGATALGEAALVACAKTSRGKILYPENLNPRYVGVLKTYVKGRGITLTPLPTTAAGDVNLSAVKKALTDDVAAVIFQSPNYFGVIEKPWEIQPDIERNGSLLIVSVDPLSLAVFNPPGNYGADIAVGEAQGLGNAMNFGGPLIGFMACQQPLIRQMPGRIVSRTTDIEGKEAYVLTLQTREQHIRREKATSNICTNEGLLALRTAVHLAILGERGFRELGRLCLTRARRFADLIAEVPGYRMKFGGPFFREFVVECPVDAERVVQAMRKEGILAGIPLRRYYDAWGGNCLLVAVTEKRTDSDFEQYCRILETIQSQRKANKI